MDPFVEQNQDEIGCVLSCFDRVVITGTLPDICHAKAMAGYLGAAASACSTTRVGPSRCTKKSAPAPSA